MKRFSILFLLIFILTACAPKAASIASQQKEIFAMNTVMTLSASGENATEALSEAVKAINKADSLWNNLNQSSEIYKLNHADGGKVQCSLETINVLQKALDCAKLTQGAFDPTIAPVSEAWNITGDPRVPSDDELKSLILLVDFSKTKIQGNEAWFLKSGMKVDLGGIGKGAISDTVMQIFKNYGVETAVFSLGGNVGVLGKKSDDSAYKVGIRDPEGTQNDTIGYLTLTDRFVISSGDYERYFMKDGIRYHHIFDPATGKPASNGLRQVCIVAENGAQGDAYSTALFVMGLEKALAFQKQQGDFEALFITADKKVILTEGLRDIFTFTGAQKGYTYES